MIKQYTWLAATPPHPNESTLLPMLVSASIMSAVQDPVEITTGVVSLSGVSLGSGNVETAVSTAKPPKDLKVFSSCVLAPSDPFTGVITPTNSSPFFLASPLHIHLEMEERSNFKIHNKVSCVLY